MTFYEFYVGKVRCIVVPDGQEKVPVADLAGMFPPDHAEIQGGIAALTEEQDFAQNCLLLETEGQYILLDTGLGTLDPSHSPQVIANLREAGIAPEQINIVVLTHGHGDHIGGVIEDDGRLNFPNARILMTRLDWDHWTGVAMRPVSERRLLPIKDRITLIEPDAAIAPCVRAIPAPGHTPGHIGIVIESEGEKLMDLVDAVHHPLQVMHPEWSPRFDTDGVLSAQTRRALFEQAFADQCRVMTYHFGFPGIGKIEQQGSVFCFVPGKDHE